MPSTLSTNDVHIESQVQHTHRVTLEFLYSKYTHARVNSHQNSHVHIYRPTITMSPSIHSRHSSVQQCPTGKSIHRRLLVQNLDSLLVFSSGRLFRCYQHTTVHGNWLLVRNHLRMLQLHMLTTRCSVALVSRLEVMLKKP